MVDQNRNQQEIELEIEQRIQEIGRLIDSSQPERRDELRQMVASLMEQELLSKTEAIEETKGEWTRRPLNPLALGLLFLILGGGFLFILPPVGFILGFLGVVGIIWGVVASLTSRKTAAEEGAEVK